MRSYSLNDLFCLTRHELFALHAECVALLSNLPDDSPDRETVLANLRVIRRALTKPALTP